MSVTSTGNDDSYSNDDNDDDEYIDNNYDHTTATSASRYTLHSKKSNVGLLGVLYLFCILLPFFHCFVMNVHMSQEWDIDVQTSQ